MKKLAFSMILVGACAVASAATQAASVSEREYKRGYNDCLRGEYDQNQHGASYKRGCRAAEESGSTTGQTIKSQADKTIMKIACRATLVGRFYPNVRSVNVQTTEHTQQGWTLYGEAAEGSGTTTTKNGGTVPDKIETYGGGTSNYNSSTGTYGAIPILLDLDGNGVKVTELSQSTVFVDAGDTGLRNRTAWADKGDGVLFFDADGDNQVSEAREYIFTNWDRGAASDMDALRSRFDTNHDGRLSALDADFSQFKVMVTQADGMQVAQTLTQLDIASIDLKPDATLIRLPDGSAITGQTTFTRTNGSTGIAADVTLATEAEGYRVVESSTVTSGILTTITEAYDTAVELAYRITRTSNPSGSNVQTRFDDNGDGVIDRVQTNLVWGDAQGTKSARVSPRRSQVRLMNATTVQSAQIWH